MSSTTEEEFDQEARFLKAREQRAQQKNLNRDQQAVQAAQELADARKELFGLLEFSGANHTKLLAPFLLQQQQQKATDQEQSSVDNIVNDNDKRKQAVAEAMNEWRTLQEGVQRVVNQVKLPAHDVQQANSALSKRLQEIEAVRSGKQQQQEQQPGLSATSTATNSNNQQQKGTERKTKFRFRRLENYKPDEEDNNNSNNTENENSSQQEINSTQKNENNQVSSSLLNPVSSSISADANNKRENLEPNSTYLIVAKQACFVRHSTNCRIYFAPVNGSIFLTNLKNCTVVISACRQLRMKDCHECDIFVCCGSTPVIEDSTKIRFGGVEKAWWSKNFSSPSEKESMMKRIAAALNSSIETAHKRLVESFKAVDDFTWLRSTPSPHWSLLSSSSNDDNDVVTKLESEWSSKVEMPSEESMKENPESCTKLF